MSTDEHRCWVCGHTDHRPYLDGSLPEQLTPEAVRITDSHYGMTAPLVQCRRCGFIYADPPPHELLALYEALEDPDYVAGSDYRLQQMRHLLDQVLDGIAPATMLDVGAGTGLLVEVARERGIDAVGVEPSRYLAEAGRARGVPVYTGIHPHPDLADRRFDLITCADVIEHVTDPVGLLTSMREALADGGRLVVTTPDPESVAARGLGARWWHHRIAHVCFFPTTAMEEACRRAGLRIVRRTRQKWWFSLPYLSARATAMVGSAAAGARVQSVLDHTPLRRIRIPLDLRDSWVYACEAA